MKSTHIGSLFLVLIIFISISACQKTVPTTGIQVRPETTEPETQVQRDEFNSLHGLRKAGNLETALVGFNKFVRKYPKSRLTDDAYFQIGKIHMDKQDFPQAISAYQQIIERFPDADTIRTAKYQYGVAHYRLEKTDVALAVLESFPYRNLPEEFRFNMLRLLQDGYKRSKQNAKLVKIQLELWEGDSGSSELRNAIINLVDQGLDSKELEDLAHSRRNSFPAGFALMKLAKIYFHTGDFGRSRGRAQSFISRFHDEGIPHEFTQEAELLLRRIEKINTIQPGAVGLLLPLSGTYQNVGRRILNGVLLGSGLFAKTKNVGELQGNNLRLIVRDTGGSAEQAVQAIEELVMDHQVVGIIGPVLKRTSEAASLKADAFRIPMVVMSQEEGIAHKSPYIFQNCLLKSDQARAIVSYAVNELQAKRFAIVYPKHAYGEKMFQFLWDELEKYPDVQITAVESYERDKTDFGPVIRRLSGLFYLKARNDELCRTKESKNCYQRDELPPIVDFDVVLVPDSAEKVRQIAPSFSYYGIRGMQLLGINLWNSNALFQHDSANYLQGATFVDGFYSRSKEPKVKGFVKDFRKQFKQEADILAAQAYDTMLMFNQAASAGSLNSRDALRKYLVSGAAIEGATGRLAFSKDGEPDRKMYFFMIDGKKIRPLYSEAGEFPQFSP